MEYATNLIFVMVKALSPINELKLPFFDRSVGSRVIKGGGNVGKEVRAKVNSITNIQEC